MKIEEQIKSLITYATSDSVFGNKYEFGYQSLILNGVKLEGQRDPKTRIEASGLDFKNKVVLDLGCNQGGMLHYLFPEISSGVGLDYNSRLINIANKVRAVSKVDNLEFYTFDLDRDPLDLIDSFISGKVDIVFLLAICMWIKRWKLVIDKCKSLAPILLFEANGSSEQQLEQEEYLRAVYSNVELLIHSKEDSWPRKLFRCSR